MALSPGTRLGHYEIVASLGAGGMGEVYRARDPRLERDVAIKVLPEHLADDPSACARFEREARAVAALSHPNILAIYDVGEENGVHFAVMELLEGQTLEETLAEQSPGWQRTLDIGIAIASGLEAAHAKGLFHRDIKPANLFITSAGSIKILDFGLARKETPAAADSQTEETIALDTAITQPGVILGTPQYLSPEQVRGHPADARSDIFALGAVLYEALAGHRPFGGASAIETMASILRETPPPLEISAPPELHDVVKHCLEKDPDRRFQTATDLAMSLRAMRGATTFVAHTMPAAPPRRTSAWIAWSILAANVVMAVLVGFNVGGMRDWLFKSTGPQRLAVLPLELVDSGNDEDVIYADALTQSLINTIGEIDNLRVISPFSVRQYAGQVMNQNSLAKIASELDVDWIVHGTIQQTQDDVLIMASLVDAKTGEQYWGGDISGLRNDMLGLQRKAARQIAKQIEIELSPMDEKALTAASRHDPEAYHLYLQGLYYANRRTRASLTRAVELFEKAIAIDATLAHAHALLADNYVTMVFYGFMSPTEALLKANNPLHVALRHEPPLPEAYSAEGAFKFAFEHDLEGAVQSYEKAIRLNPSYSVAWHRYALVLSSLGRHDEAIRAAKEALEVDPHYPLIINAVATCCFAAGRYDETVQYCEKIYDKKSGHRLLLGRAFVQLGEYEKALAEFDKAIAEILESGEDDRLFQAFRGHALAAVGRTAEAEATLDALHKRYEASSADADPYEIAMIYVGLGAKPEALRWLREAVRARSPHVTGLKFEPMFDLLRNEPAFEALLDEIYHEAAGGKTEKQPDSS